MIEIPYRTALIVGAGPGHQRTGGPRLGGGQSQARRGGAPRGGEAGAARRRYRRGKLSGRCVGPRCGRAVVRQRGSRLPTRNRESRQRHTVPGQARSARPAAIGPNLSGGEASGSARPPTAERRRRRRDLQPARPRLPPHGYRVRPNRARATSAARLSPSSVRAGSSVCPRRRFSQHRL